MEKPSDKLLNSLPPGFGSVVIGASGGIGAALCDRLGREPHMSEVFPLSRSEKQIDILDEASVEAAAQHLADKPIRLLICATGILGVDGHPPEKTVRQIDPDRMLRQFAINTVGPALIAKHFLPRLDRKERVIVAFLSARVGSIEDNRLGGWISYRASKAALNQVVHTAAIEYARTHPAMVLTAIHPGTVRTELSAPFAAGHPTVSPQQAASSILTALNMLTSDQSGSFIAYDGTAIPW